MQSIGERFRWPLMLLGVVGTALLVAAVAGLTPAQALPGGPGPGLFARPAPTRSALDSTWTMIGSSTRDVMNSAAAMDTDAHRLYVYGGLNKQFVAQKLVEAVDLSSPTLSATHQPVAAGGALPLAGAAGAYRAKGVDSDLSGVYFFGGTGDPQRGQAGNDVQRYLTKAGKWERVVPANDNQFTARMFAAAAYDASHDVLWVVGGVGNCALPDVLAGKACTSRAIDTLYLSFDARTGNASWNVLPNGALSLYGHTLVYDPIGQRLLAFGGTTDIQMGLGVVRALNLADRNPANATWSTLATTGNAPSLYFHGASLDTDWRWMVTYGGVRSGYLQKNEAANEMTHYLDLRSSPPAWADLRPLGSPGDRIVSAMAFDPLHGAAIVTLGRKVIDFAGDPPTPQPAVQRTTWGLECVAAVPTPSPTPPFSGPEIPKACPNLSRHVPAAVVANALANPRKIQGWGQLCFPNQPPSPYNVMRTWLVLDRPVDYHPLYNSVVFECGCR